MAQKKCKCDKYFRVYDDGALRCDSCGRLSQNSRYQQPEGAMEYPTLKPAEPPIEDKNTTKPEDKSG